MKKRLEFTSASPEHKVRKPQGYEDHFSNQGLQYSSMKKPVDKSALLHKAVRSGRLELVKRLVEEGVDIESKTAWGGTPLYIAVTKKHFDIAKFLLEAGANPSAETSLHDSPLNAAVGFVDIRFAILLIERGANVEQVILGGDRPLHTAVKYCNTALVDALLAHGADIEARSVKGQTPLAIAINSMSSVVVRVLAWYGAHITKKNVYDAIMVHATYDENLSLDICRIAIMLNSLFDHESQEENLDISSYDIFKELSQAGKDLVFNRLLHQSFRNKTLSLEEVQAITNHLISKLDHAITKLNLDMFNELRELLCALRQDITVSSYQNEVGNVPSLFTLTINALKKSGFSIEEIEKNSSPDIADKTEASERIKEFFDKICVTLKSDEADFHSMYISQTNLEESSCTQNGFDDYDLGVLLGGS